MCTLCYDRQSLKFLFFWNTCPPAKEGKASTQQFIWYRWSQVHAYNSAYMNVLTYRMLHLKLRLQLHPVVLGYLLLSRQREWGLRHLERLCLAWCSWRLLARLRALVWSRVPWLRGMHRRRVRDRSVVSVISVSEIHVGRVWLNRDLVDYQEVWLGDARTTFSWDFITSLIFVNVHEQNS